MQHTQVPAQSLHARMRIAALQYGVLINSYQLSASALLEELHTLVAIT
jgi:hypothetical protein